MPAPKPPLTREQIIEIFNRPRNRGAQAAIAKRIGIRDSGVSMWLSGKRASAPTEKAAQDLAGRLLKAERLNRSTFDVIAAFGNETDSSQSQQFRTAQSIAV
jgi:hypothetical protein